MLVAKDCIDKLYNSIIHEKKSPNYEDVRHWIHNYIYLFRDLYTGIAGKDLKNVTSINTSFVNIEHIIPAGMACRNINRGDNHLCEARHDPHLLFPCVAFVNSLRRNSVFNEVPDNKDSVIYVKYNNISDKPRIIEGFGSKSVNISDTTGKIMKLMTVDEFNTIDKMKIIKWIQYKKEGKKFCIFDRDDIGSYDGLCMIEPQNKYKGMIARIIFYYYLIYVHKCIRGIPYDCYNIGLEWKNYDKNMHKYIEWHKKFPANDEEHFRNKILTLQYGFPNIFVGYYDKKMNYIEQKNDIIDYIYKCDIKIDSIDICSYEILMQNRHTMLKILVSEINDKLTKYAEDILNIQKQIDVHDDKKSELKQKLDKVTKNKNEYDEVIGQINRYPNIFSPPSKSIIPKPSVLGKRKSQYATLSNKYSKTHGGYEYKKLYLALKKLIIS